MAQVTCMDGSVLEVRPVPVRARDDVAYEVTLQLLRDGAPFGEVGERCGWFLSTAAARLRAARTADDGAPTSALEAGVRRWAMRTGADPDRTWDALEHYLPRDRELLAFRSRDPDDLAVHGELRIELRSECTWQPGDDGRRRGRWAVADTAVLDAWGDGGIGLRAVLGADDLLDLLERLVREVAAAGAAPAPAPASSAS